MNSNLSYTVQALALRYAEALLNYQEALQSDWSDKEFQVREALEEMNLSHADLQVAVDNQLRYASGVV